MKLPEAVIVCRTARERFSPGAALASSGCKLCDEPLQISDDGRRALLEKPGAWLLCNPCSLELAREIEKLGVGFDLYASKNAREQARGSARSNPLNQFVEKRGGYKPEPQ